MKAPVLPTTSCTTRGSAEINARGTVSSLGTTTPCVAFLERRIGGSAEDAVQNVWVAITRFRDRFQRRSSFRTYLFAVAKNQARETHRRRLRDRRVCPLDDDSTSDPAPGAAIVIEQMQDARQLANALAELPLDLQRLVALYYFENRTAREIGDLLGVPENTARSRIRRAKELLRRELRLSAKQRGFNGKAHPVDEWWGATEVPANDAED